LRPFSFAFIEKWRCGNLSVSFIANSLEAEFDASDLAGTKSHHAFFDSFTLLLVGFSNSLVHSVFFFAN